MLIALAFSAATLLAPSSQQVKQAADTAEFREAIHRLAVESPDVARQYERLASEPLESRPHLFAVLPSSMKSAVWTHHLLVAVTNHAEFSREQRALLYDAIRLLSPELFETSKADGNSSAAFEVIHDLTQRAQLLFPRNVALALFVEIGSAIPIAVHPEEGIALNRERTRSSATEGDQRALRKPVNKTPNAWNCSCSVASDWCGYGFECTSAGCQIEYSNCGTFLLFDCNGVCVYTG